MDKSSTKEIFDLNNLDDLSDETKNEILPIGLRKNTEMLLSLFEIKEELSIDEIIVGMARKYGVKKKRTWVSSTIYNLKRRKIIKEVEGKKKVYEKI